MRKISILISVLGLAGCAEPSENLTAPEIHSTADYKEVATCLHAQMDKQWGTTLRTEDLSFKGEYRFSPVINTSCIFGLGSCGSFAPWSVSIVKKPAGTSVFVNAGFGHRSPLMESVQLCIRPAPGPVQ